MDRTLSTTTILLSSSRDSHFPRIVAQIEAEPPKPFFGPTLGSPLIDRSETLLLDDPHRAGTTTHDSCVPPLPPSVHATGRPQQQQRSESNVCASRVKSQPLTLALPPTKVSTTQTSAYISSWRQNISSVVAPLPCTAPSWHPPATSLTLPPISIPRSSSPKSFASERGRQRRSSPASQFSLLVPPDAPSLGPNRGSSFVSRASSTESLPCIEVRIPSNGTNASSPSSLEPSPVSQDRIDREIDGDGKSRVDETTEEERRNGIEQHEQQSHQQQQQQKENDGKKLDMRAKRALAEKMVDDVHELLCSIWPSACDFDRSSMTGNHRSPSPSPSQTSEDSQSGLVPLRTFIREIVRRSKSSCGTLKCAEFYLTRLRKILYEENRITSCSTYAPTNGLPEDSPLLCPRRALLSSLILAHKFLHDRVYSNRAWAKVSGLSVSEVSKGEIALGCILGWDLWFAKTEIVHTTVPALADWSEHKCPVDVDHQPVAQRPFTTSEIHQSPDHMDGSPNTFENAFMAHRQHHSSTQFSFGTTSTYPSMGFSANNSPEPSTCRSRIHGSTLSNGSLPGLTCGSGSDWESIRSMKISPESEQHPVFYNLKYRSGSVGEVHVMQDVEEDCREEEVDIRADRRRHVYQSLSDGAIKTDSTTSPLQYQVVVSPVNLKKRGSPMECEETRNESMIDRFKGLGVPVIAQKKRKLSLLRKRSEGNSEGKPKGDAGIQLTVQGMKVDLESWT